MRCECGAKTGVTDSRYCRQSNRIRRRRKCENGHRFTTFEQAGEAPSRHNFRKFKKEELVRLLNSIAEIVGDYALEEV